MEDMTAELAWKYFSKQFNIASLFSYIKILKSGFIIVGSWNSLGYYVQKFHGEKAFVVFADF